MTLVMEVNGQTLIVQTKAIGALMTEVATQAHGGTKTESQVELGQQIPQTRLSNISCTPQKVMMVCITTKMANLWPTGSIMTGKMEALGLRKMD